jgi:hypothetical protein
MDQRTLAILDGRLIIGHAPDIVGYAVGDAPEPALIV